MTIAIDVSDVTAIRKHLRTAGEDVGEAVPRLPGAAAFGPQVLGGAVASFAAAMQREADRLTERWAALETGVRETFDDMSAVEDEIVAILGRVGGALGTGGDGASRATGPLL